MSASIPSDIFDQYYYAHGCGGPYERNESWLAFFQNLAGRIIEDIQPKTVLDAGCALGFLVEGFRARGVEAWGVDVSEFAIGHVHESVRPYCWRGSLVDPLPQRYDLIVSIEVLEHMQPQEGEGAIANLCAHADDILFTSTPFDYKEATHFNVRPVEYWSEHFARHGFFRDVTYDASYITQWAVRYRKKNQPVHRLVYEYEQKYWLMEKEVLDLRQLVNEMRSELKGMAEAGRDLAKQPEVKAVQAELDFWKNRWLNLEKTPTWKVMAFFSQLKQKLGGR